MSIEEYLHGSVSFSVDESAFKSILARREVDGAQEYADTSVEGVKVDLLRADLYKWIVLGPSRVNSTTDSDNGWSHSGGGYTLDSKDKKLLTEEANAIYKANGEEENVFGKVRFRMRSNGVMRANYSLDGRPLPRIHYSD